MSNVQMREKIRTIIENLPNEQLPFILDYLTNFEKSQFSKARDAQLLSKIFEEDAELLKRLAQ